MMCTVCGCASGEVTVEGQTLDRDHQHDEPGGDHSHHHHDHDHHHHKHDTESTHVSGLDHSDHHHYGQGPARAHVPGLTQAKMVQIETDILSKNDQYADANRHFLGHRDILALNFVSSPGSGKTTLLSRTITDLQGDVPVCVVEGDQQTSNDADRIRASGARALQVNTGKGCHLDAHMVGHAMEALAPDDQSLMFIENVGNLVCPAAFDLGEHHKVVILSVTEGEDKPLKYPDIFAAADLMVLNKVDLLPYLSFDVEACIANARRVNPDIQVLQVSATSGEGMPDFYSWISEAHQRVSDGAAACV